MTNTRFIPVRPRPLLADGQRARAVRARGPDDRFTMLLDLIAAACASQSIAVAAELRIGDLLAMGPLPAVDIANATGSDPDALARLLRVLIGLGLCMETDDGRIASTATGSMLSITDSWAAYALWWAKYRWPAWSNLRDSIRTGGSGVREGMAGMTSLDRDPLAAATFHRAMAGLSRIVGRGVATCCDWTGVERVVDVGGGHGEVLATVLAANPGLRGVLFDLPHAAEGASAHLAEAGVDDRCDIVSGNFFSTVPAGDAYILKTVLHDWDDAQCLAILRNCRNACREGARLVVVEQLMPTRFECSAKHVRVALRDLNMLVMLGVGRERTLDELRTLLDAARFSTASVRSAPLDFSIVEALAT